MGNQYGGVVSLEDRFWCKVSISDGCWLWTGSTDGNGYGKIGNAGKTLCAHRVSWELAYGLIPEGVEIDHHYLCLRNCVRPDHLRLATRKQNNENRNTDMRGVRKHHNKWQARAKHHGKEFCAGTFDTREEAIEAARELRNRLFTHNDYDRTVVNSVVALQKA
jgi:hypothetical protein